MRIVITLVLATLACGGARAQDYQALLAKAKLSLTEAAAKGLEDANEGVLFEVELESEGGKVVYSVDVVQGTGLRNVLIDAATGAVVDRETEAEDHSGIAAAANVKLVDAVKTAVAKANAAAVHAKLAMNGAKPEARVLLFGDGKRTLVVIDAVTGAVLGVEAGAASGPDADELDERFTASFGEDLADLGPTGRNPYFILEPGWVIELAGRKGENEVVITITVLDVTKTIAGVETRAVEEKEIVNGKIKESTRDYFAISRRTNSVYYFGEDVDVYEDGEVVGHEGAWLAGEKGARFGMFMPGVPLVGARYYQEIAPGVALDKGEITSITETLESPGGRFTDVVKVVETSDLEKDVAETNLYARGIGVVMDDDLKLKSYGKKKE